MFIWYKNKKPMIGESILAITPYATELINIVKREKQDNGIFIYRINNSTKYVFDNEVTWWTKLPKVKRKH